MSLRPEKRVKLSRTYAIHDKPVSEIVLKEPTFDDYAELGEPVEVQTGASGARLVIVNHEAVRGYIERSVEGIDPANLGLLGLPDARALREAVLGFFRDPATSTSPPTGSSSSTDGGPATSAA